MYFRSREDNLQSLSASAYFANNKFSASLLLSSSKQIFGRCLL